jgi:hypothetical protein
MHINFKCLVLSVEEVELILTAMTTYPFHVTLCLSIIEIILHPHYRHHTILWFS